MRNYRSKVIAAGVTTALLLGGILFGPAPDADAGLSSLDTPQGLAVVGDEVFTGFTTADNAFLAANGIASVPVATAPAAAGVTGVSIGTAEATGLATSTAVAGVGMFGWLKGWFHANPAGVTGLSPGPVAPGWTHGTTGLVDCNTGCGGGNASVGWAVQSIETPAYGSDQGTVVINLVYTGPPSANDAVYWNHLWVPIYVYVTQPWWYTQPVWITQCNRGVGGRMESPSVETCSLTLTSSTYSGKFDHIEIGGSGGNGPVPPQTAWYPPGHPQRPVDARVGTGTVSRHLHCVGADGGIDVSDFYTVNIVTGGDFEVCLVTGLTEALNPGKDESHGSTEEVPGRASGAGDPDGGRSAA